MLLVHTLTLKSRAHFQMGLHFFLVFSCSLNHTAKYTQAHQLGSHVSWRFIMPCSDCCLKGVFSIKLKCVQMLQCPHVCLLLPQLHTNKAQDPTLLAVYSKDVLLKDLFIHVVAFFVLKSRGNVGQGVVYIGCEMFLCYHNGYTFLFVSFFFSFFYLLNNEPHVNLIPLGLV